MFEKRKARQAQALYDAKMASWKATVDGYSQMIEMAKTFEGFDDPSIMLGKGESIFYVVTGCSLVETRSVGGHFVAGSAGVSLPLGSLGGRPVRYRVGATRGHYQPGTPTPTAIDHGNFIITNQRVIFQGTSHTRECLFSKMIGVTHTDQSGESSFSVSNREKPLTVHYGQKCSAVVDFRLDLAVAHYKNSLDEIIAKLDADLETAKSLQPVAPATPSV